MKKLSLYFIYTFFALQVSCSNIFEKASNKTTDEAILEDATKALDSLNYDTAISKFSELSAEYKSRQDVIEQWAGAYAGKCGLDFISFFTNLGSASLAGSTIFRYFMNAFDQVSIDPASCKLAEEKMNEISSSPSGRNSNQNLFMMILGMAKIGTYLRYEADRDSTNNLGDGSMDVGFDACAISATDLPGNPPVIGQYSDNDIKQIITGLGQVLINFAAVGASAIGGGTSDSLNGVTAACAALPKDSNNKTPCEITNPDAVDASTVILMRELLHTGPTNGTLALGIGNCTTNPALVSCCGL